MDKTFKVAENTDGSRYIVCDHCEKHLPKSKIVDTISVNDCQEKSCGCCHNYLIGD